MVNVAQRDQELMRQLNQRWKETKARSLSIFREQEDALRFASNQSQQSHSRNEELRSLNRDNRLLAAKVRAMGLPSKEGEKPAAAAPINLKNKKKKASSQSSSDPISKQKEKRDKASDIPETAPPVVEAPKELPPIPQLDLGCRFVPTDQELIVCLRKKMAGEPLPKFIIERDLYASEEPKHLFRNNPTASEMYFFTPIKIKFDSGKRADRIVGSGTWKLQNNRDVFNDPTAKKTVIGCKRTLNFIETQAKGKSDSWIMHEYILKEKDQGRWAICRVKRGRGNFVGLSAPSSSQLRCSPSPTEEDAGHLLPTEKHADQNAGKNTDELLELDLKL